jgi:RNA polymerase sigma-70 factor (ECF subfamily)
VDEEQLVAALRGLDPEALGQMVDSLGDRLLHSAFLLCGNENEAQHLVQETFLQALSNAHRFRGKSRVYTWLHGILLNLSRHYHRDRKRIVYDEQLARRDTASTEDKSIVADFALASAAMQKALRQLSESHREVVVLRFFENMKIEEIAAHLGTARGTVKSRLHYALQQMQKLIPRELNLFGAQGTEKMINR